MVRRAKVPKKKVLKTLNCYHCDAGIEPKHPMRGLICQIGTNLMVICSDCGTQVAQMMRIITQRWG